MPFAGIAVVALLTLTLCGVGILVAAIGRWKKSRSLMMAGLVPVGIVFALVVLTVGESYLPLDWRARLHMSLPPEARVVEIWSDVTAMEVVFRLPEADANGFNPEAFRSIWKSNVGSYTYPCGGTGSGPPYDPEVICAWGGGDPDGGERRLSFDRGTRTYRYSAR
jgi:hypothetical protein